MEGMSYEQKVMFDRLVDISIEANRLGFAVVVFTPQEIGGHNPRKVEQRIAALTQEYVLPDLGSGDEDEPDAGGFVERVFS